MESLCGIAFVVGSVLLGLAVLASVVLNSALVATLLERDAGQKARKADGLRAQWSANLAIIRESLVPRSRPLEPLEKEMYEPIQYLWAQADMLESEESLAVNRCSASILALRHKPSLNQTQARLAHRLIDETCAVLARTGERVERGRLEEMRSRRWLRLVSELLGYRERTVSAAPSPQPITETGLRR